VVGLTLVPLSPAVGVTVRGIDLRHSLDDAQRRELCDAFRDHKLLVFPTRGLDDDQHLAVMRTFGRIATEGLGERRAVGFVSNHRPDGVLGSTAAVFHIDYGFFPSPYEALSLYGLEIPRSGTETRFANAIVAARDLPSDLRERVAGLSARAAVDVTNPIGEAGVRIQLGRLDESYPHECRPVLWPHRDTGEEILAVWEQQTDALLPLDPEDSTALIGELFAHLYRPEHVYVHHWTEGDLVVWDNHAIQHARPDIGVEHPRTLRRVCVGEDQDLSLFAARARA
jgi:taurine dioxygenase